MKNTAPATIPRLRNGIVFNYAIVIYDKSKSKEKIVQDIADELPVPPVASWFLCGTCLRPIALENRRRACIIDALYNGRFDDKRNSDVRGSTIDLPEFTA